MRPQGWFGFDLNIHASIMVWSGMCRGVVRRVGSIHMHSLHAEEHSNHVVPPGTTTRLVGVRLLLVQTEPDSRYSHYTYWYDIGNCSHVDGISVDSVEFHALFLGKMVWVRTQWY